MAHPVRPHGSCGSSRSSSGVLPSVLSQKHSNNTVVFPAYSDSAQPSRLLSSVFLGGGPQKFSGPGVPAGPRLSIPPVVSAVPSSMVCSSVLHVPPRVSVSTSSPCGPEIPPPPSYCEVNVAFAPGRCLVCIPGLYVCPAHLVACGAECFICCNFCLRVLCDVHM